VVGQTWEEFEAWRESKEPGEEQVMTQAGIYRHYKGGLYTVLMTALESTNGRERAPVVVYVSHQDGSINVRDEREFHEPVEGVPRFAPLGEAKGKIEWLIGDDGDWLYANGARTSARVGVYDNGPSCSGYWWGHDGEHEHSALVTYGLGDPYGTREAARDACLDSFRRTHPRFFGKE
jgi:hypothetical protein